MNYVFYSLYKKSIFASCISTVCYSCIYHVLYVLRSGEEFCERSVREILFFYFKIYKIYKITFLKKKKILFFILPSQWLFFLSWVVSFVILLLLFWQRKKSPLNLYLLLLFTLFMSYGIATLGKLKNFLLMV